MKKHTLVTVTFILITSYCLTFQLAITANVLQYYM